MTPGFSSVLPLVFLAVSLGALPDCDRAAFVAADRLGLLAWDVSTDQISESSLAGVLWVPEGVVGVRGIPGTSMVTLVDNSGRVLVADIAAIDERHLVASAGEMFPTALRALRSGSGAGIDDPRIVWRSREGLITGTLPPLVDPSSGLIFGGSTGTAEMKLGLAFEPRLRVTANLGRTTLSEIDSIIPLGIAPPSGWLTASPEASAAAFRVETTLPARTSGAAEIELFVASELVEESPALETPGDLPRAHLRSDGLRPARVVLRSALPQGATPEETEAIAAKLRHQRGANRFVSSWIVAVADPRALEDFDSDGTTLDLKAMLACEACERPASLKGRDEASGVHEIYSAGRFFALRANVPPSLAASFGSSLETRVRTVMADTIRIPSVQVAGQDPPLIGGAIQGSIYAHSGELEVPAVDLDAGGRAGWNVIVDRTYRSRTIGMTPLGLGWTSSMFRRLREMPNGDVEYRDEAGETWRFRGNRTRYNNVRGLMLHLTRSGNGWTLIDPLQRRMVFDDYGRLTEETDEFWKPSLDGKEYGNTTRYLYGRDGRLQYIRDAVGRQTELFYYETGVDRGLLREVRDWRGRGVQYRYDNGRLTEVALPEVEAAPGVPEQYAHTGANRPRIRYTYAPSPATYTDRVDLGANLVAITDPNEVANGGPARVAWTYGPAAEEGNRDRIVEEVWPCGTTAGGGCREAKATIGYGVGANVIDVLGQRTMYSTANGPDGRAHIDQIKQYAVPVVEIAADEVPVSIEPLARDLTTAVTARNQIGQPERVEHPDGSIEVMEYSNVVGGVMPLPRVANLSWQGADGLTRESRFDYEPGGHPFEPVSITRGDETRTQPVFYRDKTELMIVDDDMRTELRLDLSGRVTTRVTGLSAGGEGVETVTLSYPDDDAVSIRRGLTKEIIIGDTTSQLFDYVPDGLDLIVKELTPDRGELTRRFDAHGRLIELRLEQEDKVLQHERIGYDASSHAAYRARYQTGIGWVEETYAYDPLGRAKRSTLSEAVVAGETATLVSETEWDLANRVVVSTGPATSHGAGPRSASFFDALGRMSNSITRSSDGEAILQSFTGYDMHGSPAWISDGVRTASYRVTDSLGRTATVRGRDGVTTGWSFDVWDQPLQETVSASSGSLVAARAFTYTRQGSLRSESELVDAGSERVRRTLIESKESDAGAFSEVVRVGESYGLEGELLGDGSSRVTRKHVDARGRLVLIESGSSLPGSNSFDRVVSRIRYQEFVGQQPMTSIVEEPIVGAEFATSQKLDALGRATHILAPGEYFSAMRYDEMGNMLGGTAPGMNEASVAFDSRGLPRERRHPDGAVIALQHDAMGSLVEYLDESGDATRYVNDGLGRNIRVTYADATTEETRYEPGTGRVIATKDRADQWLSYEYDEGGRLSAVYGSETPSSGRVVTRYEYDDAGRLTLVRNRYAAIAFGDFDPMGRPRTNRALVYQSDEMTSGLSETPIVIESYVQAHRWNAFGEIDRWSLPAPGAAVPTAPFGNGWRTFLHQTWDAAGTLIELRETPSLTAAPGAEYVASASTRSPGRLQARSAGPLLTAFEYDDGKDETIPAGLALPDSRESGLLRSFATRSTRGTLAAGVIGFDASIRADTRLDLALGGRTSNWSYDERGRLAESLLLAPDPGHLAPIHTASTSADFVSGRDVDLGFSAQEIDRLHAAGIRIGRTPWSADEGKAHQIASIQEIAGSGNVTRQFAWDGGRRTEDGRWMYEYDERARLVSVESESEGRRIEYRYDPMDRLIQRIAKQGSSVAGWSLEDRPTVLARDGLPPRTTFVWDPLVDRLVAIFRSRMSRSTTALPGYFDSMSTGIRRTMIPSRS